MIRQRVKDIYFDFAYLMTRALFPFFVIYYKSRKCLKIHLGCGTNYLKGFVNIDGNIAAKKDLFLDLRNGLPFKDASVSLIYTSNMLEHFYFDEVTRILKEAYRVLSPGAVIRIVVPDMEKGVFYYLKQDPGFFSSFPENFSSIGGKFVNFLFCNGQHRISFDFYFLKELLLRAGFKEELIKKVGLNETAYLDKDTFCQIMATEGNPVVNLCVEALK
ncbi:MAG TPA: methyltransferase domain-containing protein [Candidatus Margulisiibacteriota bacterium]|nr:methyltransferase domain-containing protein [Candidatus Margulisiibacteriota bacterium]